MYHQHFQVLMSFAEPVCRWVRFGKRTHRRGVFGGYLQKSGFVLMITDDHGRGHGRSRNWREQHIPSASGRRQAALRHKHVKGNLGL